ncbi:MAG: hypothetical protein AABY86_17625 [Bdellovibrionota bacterium]
MKTHLAFILLFTYFAYSQVSVQASTSISMSNNTLTLEGEITQVLFPQEFPIQGLHICLSYIKTLNGTVALVEDSSSCHYARRFRKQIGSWARATEPAESYIQDESLKNILERLAPKATFYILEIE